MSKIRTAVLVLGFAIAGAATAVAFSPASAAQACEMNVCFVMDGDCALTDVAASCAETADSGCRSYGC